MTTERRPDQLDVLCHVAVAAIRREANEARRRLGLDPIDYDQEDAA